MLPAVLRLPLNAVALPLQPFRCFRAHLTDLPVACEEAHYQTIRLVPIPTCHHSGFAYD